MNALKLHHMSGKDMHVYNSVVYPGKSQDHKRPLSLRNVI